MKHTILALSITFAGAAAAHDLYLMPESFRVSGQQPVPIGIHNGDGFPDSVSAPRLQRLQDAKAHTSKGVIPLQDLKIDGKRAVATLPVTGSGHVLITIVNSANTESMKGGEFLEYLEEEGLTNAIEWRSSHGEADKTASERYTKFSKTIVVVGQGDGAFSKPTGLPIEFIPESDPFQVKAGGSLPVKVLFKGAPAANLMVIAASTANTKPHPIGRTGADGRILVPIDASGKWRLHTILMERMADTTVAEWESFWATLTFETPN